VIKITLIVLLMLISISAWGDWAIKGEGNYGCPDYMSAKRTNGAKLYSSVTWVQGFISGMNYQRALCRSNPQDYLSDAAEALIVELKEKSDPQ